MAMMDFKNRTVDSHSFSMVPRADIPRAQFRRQTKHLTTFDSGYLIPIFVDEVLPGDTFKMKCSAFFRMSTPIFPIMDNLKAEFFWFFVPNRLVWPNWVKFMGEQQSPGDSISYALPTTTSPVAGFAVGSIFDYMGLQTVGQIAAGQTITVQCLPLRAYMLIINQWFRDENLQNWIGPYTFGDGPDPSTNFAIERRGKRHDYFTACLPFTQKGAAVSLPITGQATVKTNATDLFTGVQNGLRGLLAGGGALTANMMSVGPSLQPSISSTANAGAQVNWYPSNLYADLSTAAAVTINAMRLAFQTQKLLERDARGGTRYTELVRSHFGVVSPDARLQRPEYLGGGIQPINVGAVPQTTATGITGGSTPQGNLAAFATSVGNHGFTQSFTEHGHIIGIVSVQADLSYQQGVRRMWWRSTRYDFYFPAFATLGEQAVLNHEIFCDGTTNDALVFGYAERWAEYRYFPAMITGLFKSTAAGHIDQWHLSQQFSVVPTLNDPFIQDTPPVSRVVAAGSLANGQQFIGDFFFDLVTARPMPLFSVPGLIDHF